MDGERGGGGGERGGGGGGKGVDKAELTCSRTQLKGLIHFKVAHSQFLTFEVHM